MESSWNTIAVGGFPASVCTMLISPDLRRDEHCAHRCGETSDGDGVPGGLHLSMDDGGAEYRIWPKPPPRSPGRGQEDRRQLSGASRAGPIRARLSLPALRGYEKARERGPGICGRPRRVADGRTLR